MSEEGIYIVVPFCNKTYYPQASQLLLLLLLSSACFKIASTILQSLIILYIKYQKNVRNDHHKYHIAKDTASNYIFKLSKKTN